MMERYTRLKRLEIIKICEKLGVSGLNIYELFTTKFYVYTWVMWTIEVINFVTKIIIENFLY